MNIQTVAENLRNTIAGKEQFQAKLREEVNPGAHTKTLLGFLAINLTELRSILQDVEQCAKQAANDSWAGAVDRQGGSFTDEELDPNSGWK
jgi:hypothetical protein